MLVIGIHSSSSKTDQLFNNASSASLLFVNLTTERLTEIIGTYVKRTACGISICPMLLRYARHEEVNQNVGRVRYMSWRVKML